MRRSTVRFRQAAPPESPGQGPYTESRQGFFLTTCYMGAANRATSHPLPHSASLTRSAAWPEPPAHLLPTARFAMVQHEQQRKRAAAQLLHAVRSAHAGRSALRLVRLRRGRSGSGMAAHPVTLDPGKPSRPRRSHGGRVERDGMARRGLGVCYKVGRAPYDASRDGTASHPLSVLLRGPWHGCVHRARA
jgi:hypothetical protein